MDFPMDFLAEIRVKWLDCPMDQGSLAKSGFRRTQFQVVIIEFGCDFVYLRI
jgi:hypothetical protein